MVTVVLILYIIAMLRVMWFQTLFPVLHQWETYTYSMRHTKCLVTRVKVKLQVFAWSACFNWTAYSSSTLFLLRCEIDDVIMCKWIHILDLLCNRQSDEVRQTEKLIDGAPRPSLALCEAGNIAPADQSIRNSEDLPSHHNATVDGVVDQQN